MSELKRRFTSRKLLLTVVGVLLVVVAPEHADHIVQLVGFFVGAEGARDLAEAVRKNK